MIYEKYDNYDAININKTCEIPSDYDGVMGVPISFLSKYCPEQFEILGISSDVQMSKEIGVKPLGIDFIKEYKRAGGTGHISAGMTFLGLTKPKHRTVYARIFIRRIKEEI